MDLGTFSVSLAVKDLKASRAFYEKFGFEVLDGKEDENWLMLRNGSTKIGLFQGMFEGNVLTFNTSNVREIQRQLKEQGITEFTHDATLAPEGPAYFTLTDPDGNAIMLDQS